MTIDITYLQVETVPLIPSRFEGVRLTAFYTQYEGDASDESTEPITAPGIILHFDDAREQPLFIPMRFIRTVSVTE